MNKFTVEEKLRQVEDRAAMLRFFADSMVGGTDVPDQAVFSGLGDVLGEIEQMARAARRSLPVDALATHVGPGK